MDSKVWAVPSQQTTRNVKIIFPQHNNNNNNRQSKPNTHLTSVSIQRVPMMNLRIPQTYYDEYVFIDREKEAATGRWVLNVIAAHELYKKALQSNKNYSQSYINQSPNKKKHSFQSRKSSKVEPIELSPFYPPQTINGFPNPSRLTSTTIDDNYSSPLSSFSSATSVDHVPTIGRSSISSRTNTHSRSMDYSTDNFKDSEGQPCISKRMMIICTIISIIFIIGIIIAVLVTIFVGRNQSTSSSDSNAKSKSLFISSLPTNMTICPSEMFNITDSLCNGQHPYNYYSCSQMATTTSYLIRFIFEHDTLSGHWYFDDISAVQNNNIQLIINGGFELNMTGWSLNNQSNSTSEIYVDTITNLAHTGSAYLYGTSKNSSIYIEQIFNVTQGEYIQVSFWWGYDGGNKTGRLCQAIGQLIALP